MDVCIVIPAYNPDYKLKDLISRLDGYDIIVVDDGSDNNFDFKSLGVNVLRHEKNSGKGAALKTAFNYVLHENKYKGVVTADCDGQHCPDDIIAVAEEFLANPETIVFGARNFMFRSTPIKSYIGNKITSFVLHLLYKIKLSDTQTGLRVIPTSILPILINTPGSGFEYETAVLLEVKKHKIPIREFSIKTVYEKNNKNTHFDPLKDSLKIYKLLLSGEK